MADQLGMELFSEGFNALKRCRDGAMIYCKNDQYIGKSLEAYGEFSFGEQLIFQQILSPGQTVLDVGANIGAHTLFFAKAVGVQGRVYAFEPQRVIFQQLCANMALNSLMNAHCLQVAVGDKKTTVKIPPLDFNVFQNFGGMGIVHWGEGEPVEQITIDSLKLEACHFIKADVEGMELQVLTGAKKTIHQFKPVLYVENDRKEHSEKLIRHIQSLDYALYWHLPPMFNKDNYFKNPHNIFGGTVSCNMLCIPNTIKSNITGLQSIVDPKDWRLP